MDIERRLREEIVEKGIENELELKGELKLYQKTFINPNKRSKWPLLQPTWIGFFHLRNWFNSKADEHPPCKDKLSSPRVKM